MSTQGKKMPMIRYPFWTPQVGTAEHGLVARALNSNYLNEGDLTARFESQVAQVLGCRFAVAVTSGTAALYLSLKALGIGAGDEVIVPDVTFIATANAVTMTGATPVPVDVNPMTLNMAPDAVRAAVTPRTAAVIPVHVSGRAADLQSIQKIAEQHGLHVVEDAAEAMMSRSRGRCLGTIARLGCFSLSPNKTISTGQGGLIATDDRKLHERLRELKDQGRGVRGTGGADAHPVIGFNFKFTNLQAAVGIGQLEMLPQRIDRLRAIQRRYASNLRGIDGIQLYGFREGEVPQWIDARVERRDEFIEFLAARGAQCRAFWHPLHTHPPYRRDDADFINSTRVAPQSLWLPSSFTLTDEDVDTVCSFIRTFLAGARAKAA